MRINNNQATPVRLHHQDIKEVDKFVYLGSVVSKNGGADEDIQRPIWNSASLSPHNKIRIFNTNVKSVLLYGSETWKVTKRNTKKLQTFVNKCLINIMKIK